MDYLVRYCKLFNTGFIIIGVSAKDVLLITGRLLMDMVLLVVIAFYLVLLYLVLLLVLV